MDLLIEATKWHISRTTLKEATTTPDKKREKATKIYKEQAKSGAEEHEKWALLSKEKGHVEGVRFHTGVAKSYRTAIAHYESGNIEKGNDAMTRAGERTQHDWPWGPSLAQAMADAKKEKK